ncbi:MAG: hypothetical protein IIB37_10415 [Gemmatimonadetes bacterium]|nr:hypothetical protein [Gemmatimonadota bacterium]
MVAFGSRRGEAGSLTMYLMVGAFLMAGGFFFWLSIKATPVEVVVIEGEDPVEQSSAMVVPTDTFSMDPMAYAGMVVELRRLGVQGLLGNEAFFVLTPGGQYLVKMLPELVVIGGDLEDGATVSVTGTVHAMTDSVADAWVASGGIGQNDRIVALFAVSFIEARAVSVTAPPQPDPDP